MPAERSMAILRIGDDMSIKELNDLKSGIAIQETLVKALNITQQHSEDKNWSLLELLNKKVVHENEF